MKTTEEYFRDWISEYFGYGYGTGELHIVPAVRKFLERCEATPGHCYNYNTLESSLTPVVAWLL